MVVESDEALMRALSMDGPGPVKARLLRSQAEMRQGVGIHAGAVRLLDVAIEKGLPEDLMELYFLRGDCGGTPNMVSFDIEVFYRRRALKELNMRQFQRSRTGLPRIHTITLRSVDLSCQSLGNSA